MKGRMMFPRSVLYLLVCGLVVGCGDDVLSVEDVVGSYALESVNAILLPVMGTAEVDGEELEATITAGSLTLNSDRSWTASLSFTITAEDPPREIVQETSGTFTILENNNIRFNESDGGRFTGGWEVGTIVVVDEGQIFLFRR